MTDQMKSLALSLTIAASIGYGVVAAQTARPATDAQTLSRGWTALAAGRPTEAISLADGILKRKPRSHAAFILKIEALSTGAQPLAALDAYEAWVPKTGGNVDDRGLLQPIAIGMLRVLSTDRDAAVRAAALKFLVAAGDDSASEGLKKLSAEGNQQAMLALSAEGDPSATASLQTLLNAGSGRDMSATIKSLAQQGRLTPELIQTLAKDRVPMNRAALADALASSKDPAAQRLFETLSQDPDPLVHLSVTVARAKNGDDAALAEVRRMLASEVPDIRLSAAEALFTTMPRESEEAVRSLLSNPDGLNRFRAAAIVGRSDPAAVQSVLMEGLANPSPLIQQETARIVGEVLPNDVVFLRQLLRYADRNIVVQAAGALASN
jgi:HEAT repeat protein